MKSNTVSLRRRQVLIAGVVGTTAPAVMAGDVHLGGATFAGELVAGDGGLVVSGRVIAADGMPLSGAAIEVWAEREDRTGATATTDGDGRFFTTIAPAQRGRPREIHYQVSRNGRTLAAHELQFARGRAVSGNRAGHLQRDDAGAWRAAFGVTLA